MSVTAPAHRKAVQRSGLFAFSSAPHRHPYRGALDRRADRVGGAARRAHVGYLGQPADGHGLRLRGRGPDRRRPAALRGLRVLVRPTSRPAARRSLRRHRRRVSGRRSRSDSSSRPLAIGLTYRLARYFAAAPAAALAAALVAPVALSSANNSYVLPHSISAPLSIVLVLGAMLPARPARARGRRHAPDARDRRRRSRRWSRSLGPSSALALYAAVGAWFAYRIWTGRDERPATARDALAFLTPALADPGRRVRRASRPPSALHELLFVNLYPRDFVQAAGHVILDSHAPRTAASVARLLAYTLALRRRLRLPHRAGRAAVARGGRARTLALVAVRARRRGVRRRPRRRARRRFATTSSSPTPGSRPAPGSPSACWRGAGAGQAKARPPTAGVLLVVLMLAVAASTTYASFKPYPERRSSPRRRRTCCRSSPCSSRGCTRGVAPPRERARRRVAGAVGGRQRGSRPARRARRDRSCLRSRRHASPPRPADAVVLQGALTSSSA